MMPAADSAATDVGEKPATAPRFPVTSAATKNSGTPIGTVIAMPCTIEPLRTARRTLALLNAKQAAEQSARKPPSTFFYLFFLRHARGRDRWQVSSAIASSGLSPPSPAAATATAQPPCSPKASARRRATE